MVPTDYVRKAIKQLLCGKETDVETDRVIPVYFEWREGLTTVQTWKEAIIIQVFKRKGNHLSS